MALVSLTLGQLIIVAIVGFFGLFETITNLAYIITNNKELPRKQHGAELSEDATDRQVKGKVFRMLVLGFSLLLIVTMAIFLIPEILIAGGVLIFVSGIIDYYHFRKAPLLMVWAVIMIAIGLVVMLF